jgi:small subunit ribosomal protein S11
MQITKGKKTSNSKVKKSFLYVQATFNNTIISSTNTNGDVLAWASAGSVGFKGARKSTPFAAQMTAEQVCRKSLEKGVVQVDVFLTGAGSGRETALRAIQASGLEVQSLSDVTPVPHNGCRPSKKRRL